MQYFMARWFYIFILVILVGPIEYTNVYGTTILPHKKETQVHSTSHKQ
jgi:hypothetical protein